MANAKKLSNFPVVGHDKNGNQVSSLLRPVEPSFHVPVVSAFCVEYSQQETFAPVKEAKPEKIAADEGPNTMSNS